MANDQIDSDKETEDVRISRDAEVREAEGRPQTWSSATVLPVPKPQDGYVFRWIRTTMRGEADNTNVSRKLREGWVPVKLSDHPELRIMSDIDIRPEFDGNVVVGGLMLCKIPEELMAQRKAYSEEQAQIQMDAVDSNYLREQDARMPLLPSERSTRVTFGDGS